MKYTSILFDFDGTVANTNGLVLGSWKHAFRVLRGIEQSDEFIKKTFGEPLGVSMQKFFPEVPVDEAISIYRSHQKDIFEEMIEPFPGMVELIKELKARGYKVALTTSRLYNSTMVGVRKFGLEDVFDVIVTADDTTKHKPDPEPLLICLAKLGVETKDAIYIGDTASDSLAARNAGVDFGLAGWGAFSTEGFASIHHYFAKPEDMLKLLD